MARTTRSQKLSDDTPNGNLTQSHPVPSPSKPPKSPTRKRKRTSMAPSEDQPASKQPRNGNDTETHIGEEEVPPSSDSAKCAKGAGDLPLDPPTAQQILDILEMFVPFSLYVVPFSSLRSRIDTQGLLDRVFPLPTDSSGSPTTVNSRSSFQPQSYSFRTLLKESSRHPLSVLRVRFIQHFHPQSQ